MSLYAFAMVSVFMTLIMTKRLSAIVALIVVPVSFALVGFLLFGAYQTDLGTMMMNGVKQLAPTGVMLVFAILYFGLMIDVGVFDPLIRAIVRIVHGDPVRIMIGSALLALGKAPPRSATRRAPSALAAASPTATCAGSARTARSFCSMVAGSCRRAPMAPSISTPFHRR